MIELKTTVTPRESTAPRARYMAVAVRAAWIVACLSPAVAHAEVGQAKNSPAAVLQLGSQAEEAKALTRLGDQYFEGLIVSRDMPLALQHYRRAADLGDLKAMMRLGAAMALGQGVAPDVKGGLNLINEAADAGDTTALLLLADLYAHGLAGPNLRDKAVVTYERAAALDRTLALVKLGDIYRDGRIVPEDADKAVAYYRQAIQAGRTGALVSLGRGFAEGKFGGLGSQAEGIEMLRQAGRQGVPDAVLALSDCYFTGQGVPKNPEMAVSLLRDALDTGNIKAGRRLISIYRDGRSKTISRNMSMAESYLRKIEDRLDPVGLQVERLLMRTSSASAKQTYVAIEHEFGKVPPAEHASLIRKIRSVNPNAYVYLVQSRLGSLGLYGETASGQLSRHTVRAMLQYCAQRELPEICSKGPMTGRVTEVLSTAF